MRLLESRYRNPRKDAQHKEAINWQMHKNRVTTSGAPIRENKDTIGSSRKRHQDASTMDASSSTYEAGNRTPRQSTGRPVGNVTIETNATVPIRHGYEPHEELT